MLVVRSIVVGPFSENSYLVGCDRTRKAILVDPGGEIDQLLALREPGDFEITRIVCTHGHIDHLAGAAQAMERTGAPLQIHLGDRPWLAGVEAQAEKYGFENARSPRVDHFQADGEIFMVGEHEARILHTPGHSEGSCCLFFPADQVFFSGDTLFAGSVGRTDLPGGDFDKLESSIRQKLFPLGDNVRFYPGHGPGALLGEERRSNPFVGEGRRKRPGFQR